jgi:hypothetical protein
MDYTKSLAVAEQLEPVFLKTNLNNARRPRWLGRDCAPSDCEKKSEEADEHSVTRKREKKLHKSKKTRPKIRLIQKTNQ